MRAMLHGASSGKSMHDPLKDVPEKTIIQRYKEGMSIKALAVEYGISPSTIRKRLEMRGIQVRTWKS